MLQNLETSRFVAQDRIGRMVEEADRNRLARGSSDERHPHRGFAARTAAAVIHTVPVTLRNIVALGRRALPAQVSTRGAAR